ncbi:MULTISPECIES: hypothetical protein [unclassified Roseateles]|uniref:hypothetical protein n=1 Tax=unclassified Roseateles TaxID=2626991 RepID=UPI0012E39003|nr:MULTISPECIES: hypothetical protein [unclassified Roseateles]
MGTKLPMACRFASGEAGQFPKPKPATDDRAQHDSGGCAGISTVAPGPTGWHSAVNECRFPYQFNGIEHRQVPKILVAAQGVMVDDIGLVKRQPPEFCGRTCWIN